MDKGECRFYKLTCDMQVSNKDYIFKYLMITPYDKTLHYKKQLYKEENRYILPPVSLFIVNKMLIKTIERKSVGL